LSSRFNKLHCYICGNRQLYPITERLIHNIKCIKCGHIHHITLFMKTK